MYNSLKFKAALIIILITSGITTVSAQDHPESPQVDSIGTYDNNVGRYMYITMGKIENDAYVEHFYLTDEQWFCNGCAAWDAFPNFDANNDAYIMVSEKDPDPFNRMDNWAYRAIEGYEVSPSGGPHYLIDEDTPWMKDGEKQGDTGSSFTNNVPDPKEVVMRNFGSVNSNIGTTSTQLTRSGTSPSWSPNSVNAMTSTGDYRPDGSLIVADYPLSLDNPPYGNFIFLCRQSSDGITVEANTDLYKCNGDTGSWEETDRCNDGLNNDNDNQVDENDPGCAGGSTSETGNNCNPTIQTEDGSKVAYYDSSGSTFTADNGCTYGNADGVLPYPDGEANLFKCRESGLVESSYTGVSQSDAEAYCNIMPSTVFDQHSTLPVVEYFASEDVIPTGEGRYATFSGFENKFYQSLHDAETNAAFNVHSVDTWEDHNLSELSDGYEESGDNNGAYDDTWPDRMDSWTIANAGADNDKIAALPSGTDTGDKGVFDGGFAGRCPTGQKWRYETSEWKCSGAIDWSFNYTIPGVTEGTSKVGVFLDGRVFEPHESVGLGSPASLRRQSLEYSWDESKESTISIRDFSARCYAGTGGFDSVNAANRFDWKTEDVSSGVGSRELAGITGDINLDGYNTFSCEWNITAERSDDDKIITFAETGNANSLREKHFNDFQEFSNFDPASLCSGSCDSDIGVTANALEMARLTSAASLN